MLVAWRDPFCMVSDALETEVRATSSVYSHHRRRHPVAVAALGQVSRWEQPNGPRPQRGSRLRIAKLFKVPVDGIDWR